MNSLNFLSRTLALATLATVACNGAIAATASTPAPSPQSMHLEETPDAYKVTLSGSDPSKVQVSFKDRTLHVASGLGSSGARYEQSFDLPAADLTQSISVSPGKGTIVISVPKTSGNVSASSTAPATPINPVTVAPIAPPAPAQQFGSMGQILKQFAAMQRQMNAMMNNSAADDDNSDPIASLAALAHGASMGGGLGGNAVTVEDKGANYIIRAQHVDDATKLNVAVDNGNVLKITTSTETSSKASQAQSYQSSNYTQMMTLPTAVQSDKMSTKREGDSIIVTLPKA